MPATGHHPMLMTAAAAALLAVATPLLTACDPVSATPTSPDARAARAALDKLPVRPEDTGAHYDRDAWGDWILRGGCTTREIVLLGQGHGAVRGKGCSPVCPDTAPTPCWTSPYDGLRTRDNNDLQIDHVVPVKEAQRSGARGWTADQRQNYYNDPANLIAVSVHANESKGDDDPGRWRPQHSDWCAYAMTWIATKTRYHLTVDHREHTALVEMLHTCPAGDAR